MSTSARMLRLLSLLQTHRYWPGGELAERLEVSPRTLRRDIDRLRELGYDVDASRGVAGGYQLRGGAALPPLLLEDDEAVAIGVALHTAASRTGGPSASTGCGSRSPPGSGSGRARCRPRTRPRSCGPGSARCRSGTTYACGSRRTRRP